MPVGYLPDMFGHIAQMPQILRRAGIDRAVVWRGVPMAIDRNTFRWAAPDGSEVETEYLVGGYGNGAYLFDVPDRLGLEARRLPRRERRVLRRALAPGDVRHGPRGAIATPGRSRRRGEPRPGRCRGPARDPRRLRRPTRARRSPAPALGRRAPLGRPGQHADGRHLGADRPQGRRRPGRSALLERYAEPLTALHGGAVARAPARAGLATGGRQLGPRLDLRLLARRGRGPGPDAASPRRSSSGAASCKPRGARIATGVPLGGWAIVNPSPDDADRPRHPRRRRSRPARRSAFAGERATASPSRSSSARTRSIARIRLRGDAVRELLQRRRHGRELFGRQLNGARIDATPTCRRSRCLSMTSASRRSSTSTSSSMASSVRREATPDGALGARSSSPPNEARSWSGSPSRRSAGRRLPHRRRRDRAGELDAGVEPVRRHGPVARRTAWSTVDRRRRRHDPSSRGGAPSWPVSGGLSMAAISATATTTVRRSTDRLVEVPEPSP